MFHNTLNFCVSAIPVLAFDFNSHGRNITIFSVFPIYRLIFFLLGFQIRKKHKSFPGNAGKECLWPANLGCADSLYDITTLICFFSDFHIMRSLPAIVVIIACAGLCLALPLPNDVSKADEYDYSYSEDDDESFIDQQMISPNWRTLPKELFGPEYVWDTKGFPRRVEKTQARSSSTIPQKQNTQRHR
jgi:hypothetical protein